jgi:hypothetical protein
MSGSRWSLWSEDSVLSIASRGSVLSIGSLGSAASVGSLGSAGSLLSAGSALSVASALSWRSCCSLASAGGCRDVARGGPRIPRPPAALALAGTEAAVAGAAIYPLLLRDRCLTWGATDEEVARALPGDELLADPDVLSTRAVSVDAPPSAIWPWLVQMGSGRGGAYTYDWIENLFGLDMRSAEEILPQFQDMAVGDVFPLGSKGPSLRVEVLDPERALTLCSTDGNWVWTFALEPVAGGTRLVSRNRISTPGASLPERAVSLLVMEPGSLVMERKMLLGIRRRAEGLARAGGSG